MVFLALFELAVVLLVLVAELVVEHWASFELVVVMVFGSDLVLVLLVLFALVEVHQVLPVDPVVVAVVEKLALL